MKIMDRYILRILGVSLANTLGIFLGMMVIHRFFSVIELAVSQSLDLWETSKLLLWSLPLAFFYALPISMLVAVLLTFGKFTGEQESVAALAAGISRARLALVPIVLSFILGAVAIPVNAVYVPRSYLHFDSVGFGSTIDPIKALPAGRVSRLKDRFLCVGEIDADAHRLKRFFAVLPPSDVNLPENGTPLVLVARAGTWRMDERDVALELTDGSIEELSPADTNARHRSTFRECRFFIPLPRDRSTHPKRLTIAELLERGKTEHWIELSRRFGSAAAIPLFVLCAMPLVLRARSTGRRTSARGAVLYAFGIYFAYWILAFGAEVLVEKGWSLAVLGGPYALLAAGGSLLWVMRR